MKLTDVLPIQPGVTAVIGSGGKTTLINTAARELSEQGNVLLCASAHMLKPDGIPFYEPAQLSSAVSDTICCVGTPCAENKITLSPEEISRLSPFFRYTLVEADGSRHLPVKAHRSFEPVIPAVCSSIICVVGASGFDRPIAEACHCPELYAKLGNAELNENVSEENLSGVLLSELPEQALLFINQLETPRRRQFAETLAHLLPNRVYGGSFHENVFFSLK